MPSAGRGTLICIGVVSRICSRDLILLAEVDLSSGVAVQHDHCMASDAGIGFTDVGTGIPGTVSSQFDSATFQSWGAGFYARLSAHMARASNSIGYDHCQCLEPPATYICICHLCKCGI